MSHWQSGPTSGAIVDLLNRLVATRTLETEQHNRETDEEFWQLPQPRALPRSGCSAAQTSGMRTVRLSQE